MLKTILFLCFLTMASKKTIYERERRLKLAHERRVQQTLGKWLKFKHPKIFVEFNCFFEKIAARNPHSKNLTLAADFKSFRRRGKGEYYVF